MNKRATEIPSIYLIRVTGAVLVAVLLIQISSNIAKGTIFEKLNLAKNMAMEINTLISIPGDGYIINSNLHGYSFYFNGNKIEVYENFNEISKGVYYFARNSNIKLNLRLEKPQQIIISKVNNEIKISEQIPVLG